MRFPNREFETNARFSTGDHHSRQGQNNRASTSNVSANQIVRFRGFVNLIEHILIHVKLLIQRQTNKDLYIN